MSRGEYGYVYLSLEDRRRMAKFFDLSTAAFTRKYCEKTDDSVHLKEDTSTPECQFLINNKCAVYKARPTQCRTWPFWPEVLNAKAWRKDVVSFCPGINKGRLYSAKEIQKIVEEQMASEK